MIENHENDRYIIFASDEDDETTRHFLKACNVGYKQLEGRYKGEDETEFMINKKDEAIIERLIEQQESVLELGEIEVNKTRKATLKFRKTGQKVPLGSFTAVTEAEAEKALGYTHDPSTNTFYVAK